MDRHNRNPKGRNARPVAYIDGRICFTRGFERRLFFVLTLLMLGWGVLSKLGWL